MSTTERCPHCGKAVPPDARFCQECGGDVTKGRGLPARPFALAVTALILIALIALAGLQLTRPRPQQAASPAGKERPTQIAGAGQMPTWLLTADRSVVDDYVWASSHLAELQYIPCYCGCGSVGHTDNYSCYFKRDRSGKITGYDDHAIG